jgi:hypothetical protein
VVFLVDSAGAVAQQGRTPLAELVDFQFGVADPIGSAGADAAAQEALLTAGIQALLGRQGVRPDDLWLISMAQAGGDRLAAAERAAVRAALHLDGRGAPGEPQRITAADQVGDAVSALGGFQLAAVLARSDPGKGRLDRISLLTSMSSEGAVACALVRT